MKMTSEADLSEYIKGASGPLQVSGGGTRGIGVVGEALSVAGLSGITLYEPGALTMVAQAGTPVAEIEAALDVENQRLAFEPVDHRRLLGTTGTPTIGGVFSGNYSGPRRISVGAARDFLLGVRFVDGQGSIVKNGGRVMKNVTGYDLVKLMAGSFGTLGVLSEVSLKVLPKPETQQTLVLHGLDDVAAIAALTAAMGSPFEVSGAAHDPGAGQTYLRFEGFEASVGYRMDQVRGLLKDAEAEMSSLDAAASGQLWTGIKDIGAFEGQEGDVWRLSCKPTDGAGLAAKAGALGHLLDWSGGLIWFRTAKGHDLRATLGSYEGHATLVRADASTRGAVPMFEPEAPGVAKLTQGLRARFDPKGILNPGLMGTAG